MFVLTINEGFKSTPKKGQKNTLIYGIPLRFSGNGERNITWNKEQVGRNRGLYELRMRMGDNEKLVIKMYR